LNNLKNLRGTVDLLPDQLIKWQNVEKIVLEQFARASIKEIRTPILEMTELFIRGIGEETDVVSKEMYTFLDRGERSCTLRPEGTASVARALIQNGLSSNPLQKLWYMGPMFRYERPQAGRQRQFHQLGVEFIGYESVRSDVEIIALAWDILGKLGIKELNLEINTLGDINDRLNFQESFLKWLEINKNSLDLDSQNRINKNPLRILDTKNVQTKKVLENAPRLFDFLSEKSHKRYAELKGQGYSPDFVLIGKKAIGYFENRASLYNIRATFKELEQVPTSEDAGSITSEVLAEFLSESTDRVEVIFTKFVSLVSCNPTIQTLLPLDPQGIADSEDEIFRLTTKDSQLIIEKDAAPSNDEPKLPSDIVFEQSPDQLLNALLPLYLQNQLLRALQESAASELASRMTAMNNASDNAKELAKNLTIDYNKARQAAITLEILEVVGGAAA